MANTKSAVMDSSSASPSEVPARPDTVVDSKPTATGSSSAASENDQPKPEEVVFKGPMIDLVIRIRDLAHRNPNDALAISGLESLARGIQSLQDEADRCEKKPNSDSPLSSRDGTN
ncbi:hypothetical protein CkaCkLH20_12610 [Colletotrichum karsti]|uniref:Uncharacterized protein n=1 Tax=Colletotrichum karsti TaxID=1095194 RepID=A0A9P6HSE8_9PEZI|nr:uncharacterized protein CkaCkLH20_12610 [Colletotrichum karsti]KAF9869903.1 hypothetical protein CkaCkLH20_12610 [Colletotrichum karsti]